MGGIKNKYLFLLKHKLMLRNKCWPIFEYTHINMNEKAIKKDST
jgi:hypothetical protein